MASDSCDDIVDEELSTLRPKRARIVNWKKGLICQSEKAGEALRVASSSGIETVLLSSQTREDGVSNILGEISDLSEKEIFWHGSCYSSYASKWNLSFFRIMQQSSLDDDQENKPVHTNRSSRSIKLSKINWSLCMFCQKVKHKGTKALVNVSSLDACTSIHAAAAARGDQAMITNIAGVDLIAVEAITTTTAEHVMSANQT